MTSGPPRTRATPRDLLAAAVVIGAVVAVGYTLRTDEPSQRKLLGDVVALELYADLERPPISRPVPPEEDTSRAAPGRPGGYERAVTFHDPLLPCPEGATGVDCGAKLEIFRRRSDAVGRAVALASDSDETTVRRGALLLRLSSELPTDRRTAYESAFLAAVDDLLGFRDLTRLDRSTA